jgi:hypothetical protein
MKIYRPDHILNFGQYKGEEMKFVYTFDPEYIDWLIINMEHFVINIDDYKNMHTCQLDIQDTTQRLGLVTVGVEGVLRNLTLREYLKEFFESIYVENYINTPTNIKKFNFSEKALDALELKAS